ncbi:TetR/AcrR family transcriptional regulator C-terminal domain-containing protein [Phyllobacterium sp. P30BS-XVII]|uniref:TetR/AcrR family transcriptional regulator C-terminal domain-containing protein n=1 Tax=Phyllobacterium sp. P30BS-XVII TaxID=2587046 RepID=UPI000DDAA5FF|nr:TetR/AcrR family transcriptional regulator C-terminal domain-containing protein [Phyllobacterium sp. P30BS-XVII]MBA8903763.1 TetR/AcrR family tetracycline transcriptional repressor [Phyllobacterium sp. P30BS-XVII]
MAKRSDVKLQRETVIRVALDLLDETGIDGLTTRRIATALGVQQPALYWHFKDKAALLDALAEAILVEHHGPAIPEKGEDWRHFLTENARGFRRALLAYRDGARIHAGSRPGPVFFPAVEAQIQFMVAAGFDLVPAAHVLRVTGHYVVGSVLEQQASMPEIGSPDFTPEMRAAFPMLAQAFVEVEHISPDEGFEFGLAALVAGFEKLRSS